VGFTLSIDSPQQSKIVAYLLLGQDTVGFALPILSYLLDPPLFAIQEVDELTGCVCSFRTFSPDGSSLVSKMGPSVRIGDKPFYAFIDTAGNAHLGKLKTLSPVLAQFAAANPDRLGLSLQIRELIGTDQEKKTARTEMRKFLLEKQGSAAARSFYEGSVLRSVLWSRLLSTAINSEMAKRILGVRGRLSAKVDSDGTITLDLSCLSREDLAAIDTTKLIDSILLEYDPQPEKPARSVVEKNGEIHDFAEVQREVDILVRRMIAARRQEERIALMISAILRNPPVGKTALLQYPADKAKTAEWAFKELRRILIETKGTSSRSDELLISLLIPKILSQQYHMTRGDLLFFLAKHLGSWPVVKKSIRQCLAVTHSVSVELRRGEIEAALAQLDVL
jgi:hypothetical protein